MKIIKILLSIIASVLNSFSTYTVISITSLAVQSSAAKSSIVYETKVDLNNDKKADLILYEKKNENETTSIGLKINKNKVQDIQINKTTKGKSVTAKYTLKKNKYELTYSHTTNSKVFFKTVVDTGEEEVPQEASVRCLDCLDQDPRTSLYNNSISNFADIANTINNSSIDKFKEKFPIDKSCKTPPGRTSRRGVETDFEKEIYQQLINISEDKKIANCMKEIDPIVATGFGNIPNSLSAGPAPLAPLTLSCVNNTYDCKCSPKVGATAEEAKVCQTGNCLPRYISDRDEKDNFICSKENFNKDKCKRMRAVGAQIDGNGKRSILLSNSLRIYENSVEKTAIENKRKDLKSTLAHELIHAFGCKDEVLTDCMIESCVENKFEAKKCVREFIKPVTTIPLANPSLTSDYIDTPQADGSTKEQQNINFQVKEKESISKKSLSKTISAAAETAPEAAAAPQQRTNSVEDNLNEENADVPLQLPSKPIEVTDADTQMPSDSTTTPSGSRASSRVIREQDSSLYQTASKLADSINPLPRANADSGTKSSSRRDSSTREERTPASQKNLPKINNPKSATAKSSSRSETKVDSDLSRVPSSSTQTTESSTLTSDTSSEATPRIDAGTNKPETTGTTKITNITNTTTITNNSSSGGSAAPALGASASTHPSKSGSPTSKPASSQQRYQAVLMDFKSSPNPEPVTGNLYRQIKSQLTTDAMIQFLNKERIKIVTGTGASFGSTRPTVTIIDTGDRLRKKD